jgi:ankyrin repeat protein
MKLDEIDEARAEMLSACMKEKIDWHLIVSRMQSNTADVVSSHVTHQRWTLLHYAAWEHKLDYAKLLIARGADTLAVDIHGCTPLHIAAGSSHDLRSVDAADQQKLLDILSVGHNASTLKDKSGRTPLHLAVSEGNCAAAIHLLQNGHDPNATDEDKETPLMYAAFLTPKNWRDIARVLLQHGTVVDLEDRLGRTLVTIAEEHGNFDFIYYLYTLIYPAPS